MNTKPEWNKLTLLHSLPFAPLHPVVSGLAADRFPLLHDCNALLAAQQPAITVHSGQPLHFVPQEYGKLPFEAQYEPRCYLKGEVPTRANNWHDLLNALVWLTFPQAKAAINARHFQSLTDEAKNDAVTSSQRGVVRDFCTLLDESGVIVAYADAGLADLMRNFRWKELFWQRRNGVQRSIGFSLFGHGLYEKALKPYIGMTGQGLLLKVEQSFFDWPLEHRLAQLDALIAAYLDDPQHCHDTYELTPLPLLGVPGWWADNENESFYNNVDYFRKGRSRHERT